MNTSLSTLHIRSTVAFRWVNLHNMNPEGRVSGICAVIRMSLEHGAAVGSIARKASPGLTDTIDAWSLRCNEVLFPYSVCDGHDFYKLPRDLPLRWWPVSIKRKPFMHDNTTQAVNPVESTCSVARDCDI